MERVYVGAGTVKNIWRAGGDNCLLGAFLCGHQGSPGNHPHLYAYLCPVYAGISFFCRLNDPSWRTLLYTKRSFEALCYGHFRAGPLFSLRDPWAPVHFSGQGIAYYCHHPHNGHDPFGNHTEGENKSPGYHWHLSLSCGNRHPGHWRSRFRLGIGRISEGRSHRLRGRALGDLLYCERPKPRHAVFFTGDYQYAVFLRGSVFRARPFPGFSDPLLGGDQPTISCSAIIPSGFCHGGRLFVLQLRPH